MEKENVLFSETPKCSECGKPYTCDEDGGNRKIKNDKKGALREKKANRFLSEKNDEDELMKI